MMFVRKEAFRIEVSRAGRKCTDRWELIERGEKNVGTNEKSASQKDTDGETELSERNGKKCWMQQSGTAEFRLYFSTAVVRRAAATCWNICRSIFRLRCSTTIRIFHRKRNMSAHGGGAAADPGASSGASDPVCRRKIRPGMLL